METEKALWDYEIEEIAAGYAEEEAAYRCVFCGKEYEKGKIFQEEDSLYEASGAVRAHVRAAHGSPADWLLSGNPAGAGVSEIQMRLLRLLSEGGTDRQIAAEMGITPSTVRNHRFKLREKEKQAKIFLALMRALGHKLKEESTKQVRAEEWLMNTDQGRLEEVHPAAACVDDRYGITQQEREKTLKTYMKEDGTLKQIPAREKKKIIILREIMKRFEAGRDYTEKEVNRILKEIYEADYPSIRLALIEYGFMNRADDCRVSRAAGTEQGNGVKK